MHSRVLVVEDEELVALYMRDTLLDAGFDVELLSEGTDAAVLAGDQVCAAIVDVGLPGIMGNDLAVRLRARHPHLPILLTTGYEDHVYRRQFADDSHVRVLAKPFDSEALLGELEALGIRSAPNVTRESSSDYEGSRDAFRGSRRFVPTGSPTICTGADTVGICES